MKISRNWLKDFIDIDVDNETLARTFVSAGLEVDSTVSRHIPDSVKVGFIHDMTKHPNADTLSLCVVDIGEDESLNAVCGAPNVRIGMRCACALPGTMIGSHTIKKTVIRGQESAGMLCSEKELGISDDHQGIMDLPADFVIGKPLNAYYPDDTVFDLEITSDRGDCLSVLGVARELSCAFRKPLKSTVRRPVESGGSIHDFISVTIKAPGRCPRYRGRLVRNITLGPSPAWLKDRLTLAGMRPINNIVDITNYVLLEFGQPMHAFDYNRIAGKKILVEKARDRQHFTTLDNIDRILTADDLLICDTGGGVALAGIMGGSGSEISESTTDVFLECAYFDPPGIRMSSKRMGLSTESSQRFERGVDPQDGLENALDTAAEMVRELAAGTVVAGVIDVYPEKRANLEICLRPRQVSRLLGITLSEEHIIEFLKGLGIFCIKHDEQNLVFTVPRYRHDITMEVDIVEELGRLYGYDNIPVKPSAVVPLTGFADTAEHTLDTIRSSLAYSGLNEIVTNSLVPEKTERALLPDKCEAVKILNPLSPDMAQLRTCLLGSHLMVLLHNINRKSDSNRYFEIGKVFKSRGKNELADERTIIGITIHGNYTGKSWNGDPVPASFDILKGILETFIVHNGFDAPVLNTDLSQYPYFDTESAGIHCGDSITGALGKIKASTAKLFGISDDVYHIALDITEQLARPPASPRYRPIPKFPAIERDLCFVVSEEIQSAVLAREILGISELIESVRPFDVYRGEKLGNNLKSIAYTVRLQSTERTLTDDDAHKVCDTIIERMATKYEAVLRQ